MSVVLGTAVLQGNRVSIAPPEGGFGGIGACRLSNYTGDALILTNMSSESPGQEYLLPFQQNVYRVENVRTPPTVVAVALGSSFSTQSLLVEWSNDPLTDFPGTYPTTLVQAGVVGVATPGFEVHELAVPDDGTTYVLPADGTRTSLSFINDGTAALKWSHSDTAWATRPIVAAGSGRTVDTTQAVYFRGNGAGASTVQYWVTKYGAITAAN